MAGSFGFRKSVKKSEHWSSHGKSKSRLVRAIEWMRMNRKIQHSEPMYSSVREAFEAAKKK